eukprot:UN04245
MVAHVHTNSVLQACTDVGYPLLKGGFSTFIISLVLLGSETLGFRELQAGLFSIVMFGLLHGLVLYQQFSLME